MADLTPRMAVENGWTVYGHCDRCRQIKSLPVRELARLMPERDIGEALLRGKVTCRRCERPCTGIDVVKYGPDGSPRSVMKLTPGLTVKREGET